MEHLTAEDPMEVEPSQANLSTVSALPLDTVHLIKSCQVITSVCALVKELIENALDAGATSLNIKLEGYGLQQVEVRDNGCGISEADLQVICRSHTTSKIVSFSDLDCLSSYGFRGEALFSLCQVGHVSITSRSSSAMLGHVCRYTAAGEVHEKKVAVCNTGTTVLVTDLFHSMPVRLQCLKEGRRRQRQLQQLDMLLRAYSVALPALHVVLQHDRSVVFQKSSANSTCLAVRAVFPDIARSLLTKTLTRNEVCVTVHLLAPTQSSSSKPPPHSHSSHDRLLLLVNSRPVHHKQIEKLTKAFYSGATEGCHGRYPAGVVTVTVPPSALDVNLEPNKDKILFRDEEAVCEILSEILTELYGAVEKKSNEVLVVCTLTAPTHSSKRPTEALNSSFDGSDDDSVNASTSLKEDYLSSKEKCYGEVSVRDVNGGMNTLRVERLRGKFGFRDNKRNEVTNQHDGNKPLDKVFEGRKQTTSEVVAPVESESGVLLTTALLSNSVGPDSTRLVTKQSALLSSTPQCADVSVNVIGNSAAFGSLSSIDVLTQEEQNCLEQILSQSTAEENELSRDCRQLASDRHVVPSSNNVYHNGQSYPTNAKPSLDLFSGPSMGPPVTLSQTADEIASINDVQHPLLRVSDPAGVAVGKAEVLRNALQTGISSENIDPIAWSKGHLLAEDGSNIENVRVVSSSSNSHQLPCPTARSAEPDWGESPAKRRKAACQSGGACDDRNASACSDTSRNELTEEAAVRAEAPKFVMNLVGVPTGSEPRSGWSLGSGEVAPASSRPRESDSDRRARLAVLSPPGVERLVLEGKPIRKPLTAFAMFAMEIRNEVLGVLPGAPFTEVGREIAVRWKALGAGERKRFEKGAKEQQARHQDEVRKVQEGGGLPSRVVNDAHHDTSLDRYLMPVSPQLFPNVSSKGKPPVLEAKPHLPASKGKPPVLEAKPHLPASKGKPPVLEAKPHLPEIKSRLLKDKPRPSTLSTPTIKKEMMDRPWRERSVTAHTSLQNLEQRMCRALLRAQNHQSGKTNTDCRVIGKIVYNSVNEVVTTGSSTTATASSPLLCYVCLHQGRLYGVRSHALREVLLYCQLLETCSVPRAELEDPVPFNESTIGSSLWQTLLRLPREPDPVASYERVTDPRLLNNGLGVILYAGSPQHTPTHGELRDVAPTVGFYGLVDLKEVLTVLANDTRVKQDARLPSVGRDCGPTQVALVQTRPIKLRHWMQAESVRMTRGCPGITSAAEVREQLRQLRYYTTHYCRDSASACIGGKPSCDNTRIALNDEETEQSFVKETPIPVKGWPDLSVCLHETPLLHLFYNLDELPGSQ